MWSLIRKNAVWLIGILVIGVLVIVFVPRDVGHQPIADITVSEAAVPAGTPAAKDLYTQAQVMVHDGHLQEAKTLYRRIYQEHPDYENIAQIQKELEDVNMQLLFSNRATPDAVTHEVSPGDTLGKIAKQYSTTVELIKRNNNLKSDVIRLGQKLRVWTAPFNIWVDKSQNILMVKKADEVFKVYHVSTGKEASTPIGEFTITTKLEDPVWFHKGVVVPPDSPANVLGTRWLGFDIQGYGIHGTVEPDKIGQQVTAGCVRMRNEEVEELYSFIPTGTKVVIVD